MAKSKKSTPTESESVTATGSFKPKRARAGRLELLVEARAFLRKRKIHPRRIIPKVRAGAARRDATPTIRLSLSAPRAMAVALGHVQPLAASDDLEIARSVSLGAVADNNTASNVCEPSVASNRNVVFYTGNWFASLSTDSGASFRYVNPYSAFPNPSGMQFCCDQVAHYARSIDTFIWLLQYTENSAGENIQRIAYGRTDEVAAGRWQYFDITPSDVGLPGTFLDYPDLAIGTGMLYVSLNAFRGQAWDATVLVRIPLASIQSGNITATYFRSTANFNFRVAQNCAGTAYFASHEDTSTLRVWSWPRSAQSPTFKDVTVASWNEGPYNSKTPDGYNWLGRADGRLTGAARAGSELWFCWGAGRGGANNRPHPYVQIARIKTTNLSLIENINIWDSKSATCYGALSSNANAEVAISYTIGGGTRYPSHMIGLLTGTPRHVVTIAGTRGPKNNQWGDYLTVRRCNPASKLFDATGFTLQPAGTGPVDATPQFVRFGRSSDV